MTKRVALLGFARSILAAALAGCSVTPDASADGTSTAGSGEGGQEPCVPGLSRACMCEGGSAGAQACRADGGGFDACECAGGDDGPQPTTTGATSGAEGSTDEGSTAEASDSNDATTEGSTDTGSGCAVVIDDFEREELGPDWTIYNGTPHIVDASDFGADAGLNIATWTASPVLDDQYAEGVLSEPLGAANSMLFVRRRSSDLQRYGFVWVGSDYLPCQALDPSWSSGPGGMMLKLDGGPNAPAMACVQRAPVVGGDVLRIEVEGTALRGFVNGELIVEGDDDVIPGGEPGIALVGDGDDQAGFESFEAGCLR